MAYTLISPQSSTVTKAAVQITGCAVSFAGANSAATIQYQYVDAEGIAVPGSQADISIGAPDFATIWNGGVSLAKLYAALATRLSWPAGTPAGDGSLA